jgi:hypothetical protein
LLKVVVIDPRLGLAQDGRNMPSRRCGKTVHIIMPRNAGELILLVRRTLRLTAVS